MHVAIEQGALVAQVSPAPTPSPPTSFPIKLPNLHAPHVGQGIIVAVIIFAAIAVIVGICLGVYVAKVTDPVDRLAVKRRWDWRGVRSYRGHSKNPQVPEGFSVETGRPVRRGMIGSRLSRTIGAGYEFCTLLIAGPRVGKSTSYVIPSIARAKGPVVVTSNKRDVVDATRLIREQLGDVWIFDPQRVAGAPAQWWWNPLRRVTTVQRATELAEIWIETSKAANAVPDAYFEPAGKQLLTGLIFAAALAGKPASAVFWWLADPQRAAEAIEILHPKTAYAPSGDTDIDDLERRTVYEATAEAVAGVIRQPEKQRGGVFGTAMKAVDWMQAPELRRWIEDPDRNRAEFIPEDFCVSLDTLYSLSKEGSMLLAPLVTALTADVLQAADEAATMLPGGRLARPMLGALDECANTCPWRRLPALFSFFGSRGIPLLAVFQNLAQMRTTFGAEGAQALLSAANVRITMGGVEDATHLANLEKLFGTVKVKERTQHRGGQGRGSATISFRDHPALTVADIASMRFNRAAVTFSGCRPMLVKPTAWMADRKLAPIIRESIAKYGGPPAKPADTAEGTAKAPVTEPAA